MSIEDTLARIATALEAIEDHLRVSTMTALVDRQRDGVIDVDVASPLITVEPGPHEWVNASTSFEKVAPAPSVKHRATGRPARRGQPLKCGRCRREGRSRMNHSNRCLDCQHEDFWDE